MRKARQETVEIWQQRLADKEEEWYLAQEVELKKKETQLKAECAQEKAELRAAHAQHITSLEASHGQHIAKLETEKEMRDEKIDHLSGWVRYLTEEYNKTRTELDAKINEKTSEVAHMMEQVTNLTNELRSIRGNLRPPQDRRFGPPRMNPFEESETVPAPGNLIIRARSQAGEWTEQTRHHVTLAPTVGAQGSFSTALYPDSTVLYPAVDHSGDPGDPYVDQRPQQMEMDTAITPPPSEEQRSEEATNFESKEEAPRGEKEKPNKRKYDRKVHPGCSLQELRQFVEKRSEKLSHLIQNDKLDWSNLMREGIILEKLSKIRSCLHGSRKNDKLKNDLNLLVRVIEDQEAHLREKDPKGEDQLREIKKKAENSLKNHYLNKFLPVLEESLAASEQE